jgi:hypothetical protein
MALRATRRRANHGTLRGLACALRAARPSAGPPGRIVEGSGKPLPTAVWRCGGKAVRLGAPVPMLPAITFVMFDATEPCDLFVTTAMLSAYQLGFQRASKVGRTRTGLSQRRNAAVPSLLVTADARMCRHAKSEMKQTRPLSAVTNNRVLQLDATAVMSICPRTFSTPHRRTVEVWAKWGKREEAVSHLFLRRLLA